MADAPNNPRPAKLAASAVTPTPFSSWRDHFAAERRWFADTFSGDHLIETLKQLAWVVPLTLLIWIYAEREQITKLPNETIPFELVNLDPNRVVTLEFPRDSNVVIDVEGPRARVQDVLQRLRGGEMKGLRVEVDRSLTLNREHELRTSLVIANHDIFRHNGITVTRTQPDRLVVTVDEIIDLNARVQPHPDAMNLDEGTAFQPPTVKVRGPRTLLERVLRESGAKTLVVYAHIPEEQLATEGQRDVSELPIELPEVLRDDRVTLQRSKVDATLHVRGADDSFKIDAMPVTLDISKPLADEFNVKYSSSLPGVTLVGPKDVIERMRRDPNFAKPYAQLKVSSADADSERRTRRLRFVDLPPGVRVHEKDQAREIPFSLVKKSDVQP